MTESGAHGLHQRLLGGEPHGQIADLAPGALVAITLIRQKQAIDETLAEKWGQILIIRGEVTKALEKARGDKLIGHPLDAAVTLVATGKAYDVLQEYHHQLGHIFIVSQAVLAEADASLSDSYHSEEIEGLQIKVARADGDNVLDLFRVLGDAEFRGLLADSAGLFDFEAEVSSLAWISAFLGSQYESEFHGSSTIDGTLALQAGLPAPGTDIAVHAWRYTAEDANVAAFDAVTAAAQWDALRGTLATIEAVLGPDNYDLPEIARHPECHAP